MLNTIIKWAITKCSNEPSGPTTALSTGARVSTKFGYGTVIGASIHVHYDKIGKLPSQSKRGAGNNTHTHNLDEVTFL